MRFAEFVSRFMLYTQSGVNTYSPMKLRQSAVLVPVVNIDDQAHLLLCKRPTYLKHHPGQICFPGGKVDPDDLSVVHTALRECHEELDIPVENVTILGQIEPIDTATGFSISPIIATLNWPLTIKPNPGEVEATFLISLEEAMKPSNWSQIKVPVKHRTITVNGKMTEQGLLWGATAKIMHNLFERIS